MRLWLSVALGIALAPASGIAGNPAMVLADGCATCHSAGGMPSLSGTPADQLKAVLAEFKTGKRVATVMDRIARGYSDSQIESIATYFAAQPQPSAAP